jgi:signal transduction histidine kinase
MIQAGLQLTEGERQGLKMVSGYIPAPFQHMKDMDSVVQFAGDVAHCFNDILSVVTAYADLLRMKLSPDDPSIALLDKMLASSQSAKELVRALLTFTGKEKVRLRELDLNKVIRRATRFLSSRDEKNIDAKVELEDGELFVMADSDRMEEVLLHLIENARDGMPEGGMLILRTEKISPDLKQPCATLADAPAHAVFSVTDTGVGMDEETRERAFDPFFTTKGPARNLGLGLSKVYGVVRQHAGQISIQSAPGKGTSVKVRIPLVRTALKQTAAIPLRDSIVAARLPLAGSYLGA